MLGSENVTKCAPPFKAVRNKLDQFCNIEILFYRDQETCNHGSRKVRCVEGYQERLERGSSAEEM